MYQAVRFDDIEKLMVLGACDLLDLNFKIEIKKGIFYTPLMIAAIKGHSNSLKSLLKNKGLDLEILDSITGTNAFWLAAYFDKGSCVHILGNAGSNIMIQNKKSLQNVLHVSILR